jgi:hypothetical protein
MRGRGVKQRAFLPEPSEDDGRFKQLITTPPYHPACSAQAKCDRIILLYRLISQS